MKSADNEAPPPDPLATYLANRDVPCPSCGYNVRNLATSNCPECGLPLSVRLDIADPRTGQYLACVLALGGAAAVMMTILGLTIPFIVNAYTMTYWNTGEWFLFLWFPFVVAALSISSLCLMLRRRGRAWFHSGPTRARTMLAVLSGMASLTSVVAWVLWFQRAMS